LLEAKSLSRDYLVSRGALRPKARLHALHEVSFTLHTATTLAVVGESGCGKSTLARLVAMIEAPTNGQLCVDGIGVAQADRSTRKSARPLVQMVFQNPYASLNPRKQIGAMLEEPLLLNTSLSKAQRRGRAGEMLAKVGLRPEHYHRYPHMFSGGERQRIAIARAVILHPKLVVADEPVSALDVSVQAQVLNLLADLQQDTGVAYLFISHNLAVVEHIADRVIMIYLGRVVEQGSKHAIFSAPAHPYTRALLASTPVLTRHVQRERTGVRGELPSPLNPPSGCVFRTRCPYAIERCSAELPLLRAFGDADEHVVACHRAEEIAQGAKAFA
jgi:dipeptide transport system ATP-binding protein